MPSKKKTNDREALAAVRAERAEALAQQATVRSKPAPLEEGMARLRGLLDQSERNVDLAAHRFLGPDAPKANVQSLFVKGRADLHPKAFSEAVHRLLNRQQIEARFEAAMRAALEGQETIGSESRSSQLAEIDARLRALEIEEERIVCALEAEGVDVLRRPDADPAVVLGWRGAA